MKRILFATALILSSQLPANAVDCRVSFDQRCLAQPYDSIKVERKHAVRMWQMNQAAKEQEQAAQAWAAARAAKMQMIQEQPPEAYAEQPENDRFYVTGRLSRLGRLQQGMRRPHMFRSFGRR